MFRFLEKFANKQLLNEIQEVRKGLELEKTERIADFTKLHGLVQSSLQTLAARQRMQDLRASRKEEDGNNNTSGNLSSYKAGAPVPI
jgi:hypothetical protein